MDTFAIFTWSLTAVTIFGTYLNSRQNKYGFLVWGLCNLLWLGIDFNRGIYAQAALYVVFIGFNIYGWTQWGKKDKPVGQVLCQYERDVLNGLRRTIAHKLAILEGDISYLALHKREMAIIDNLLNGRWEIENE